MNSQHGAADAETTAHNPAANDSKDGAGHVTYKGRFESIAPEEIGREMLSLILSELDEDKAEDVVTIDLAGKSDIADFMVVATGRSQRHVSAIADKVMRRLKEAGVSGVSIEGAAASDWVLIDAADVIVHLFRQEVRDFYNLERVWSENAHAPIKADA